MNSVSRSLGRTHKHLRNVVLLAVSATLTFFSSVSLCKAQDALENAGDSTLATIFQKRFLLDKPYPKKLARVVSVIDVNAPASTVKAILSDFPNFPVFMKRVKTCEVTKKEGNLYLTEAHLNKQLFVDVPCNHTITDVMSKPNLIEWVLVDGNFSSACGRWQIDPIGTHSRVTYTVAIDPPPLVPAHIVEIGMKMVQKEVVHGVKHRAEHLARIGTFSSAATEHGKI